MRGSLSKIKCIFRASQHGWESSDFHEHCDKKGATLFLLTSESNYKFGGYTSIPWMSTGKEKEDRSAFLFGLTKQMRIFKPARPEKAIFDNAPGYWPFFYGALGFLNDDLREGKANTNGNKGYDPAEYNIPIDEEGNNVLTGEGKR